MPASIICQKLLWTDSKNLWHVFKQTAKAECGSEIEK